jgi:uncharacterized protein YecE (DUF72 family)
MSNVLDKSIRIGCQSWGYDDWITLAGGPYVFYPTGLKKTEMLPFYSKVFDTVEVDATVYGIPPSTTLEKWYRETPPEFTFSLKTPREITHEGTLSADTIPVMCEFVERVSELREKLGVILVQRPPHFDASRDNAQKVRRFLAELPSGFKYAVEFRHPDWLVDWTYEELEQNNVSLALVEGPWVLRDQVFDAAEKVRTPFAYIRLMNARDLQKFDRIARYRDEDLEQWTHAIRQLAATGLYIYIYIDNYFEGFAPGTAARLQGRLGIEYVRPEELVDQPSLFG